MQMKADGVTRAVAFSQYPQYSCATTGSSLINLWQTLDQLKLTNQFKWSIIDRWYQNPMYVSFVAVGVMLRWCCCVVFDVLVCIIDAVVVDVFILPLLSPLVAVVLLLCGCFSTNITSIQVYSSCCEQN